MHSLVEDKVYLIPNLLTPKECQNYRILLDQREIECTDEQFMIHRFQEQYSNPQVKQFLWNKLKDNIPSSFTDRNGTTKIPYKCADIIPIVKYFEEGVHTVIHKDPRKEPDEEYGVIIYLGGTCNGGDTVFYDVYRKEIARAHPKEGNAVMFHMDTLHKGEDTHGTKYIICPRICYRPG